MRSGGRVLTCETLSLLQYWFIAGSLTQPAEKARLAPPDFPDVPRFDLPIHPKWLVLSVILCPLGIRSTI